jgi:hypothetical protein
LDKEILDGIVEEVNEEDILHWNPSFIIPKSNGKFRKILDCREVNKASKEVHFKIDGTKEIMDMMEEGDYGTILDLEGAYHHVRVEGELRRYFGFRFNRRDYLFRGLPFGWLRSPAIFCQILRIAIKAIIKETGVKMIVYMDDLLILG